ncbi:hypothetical protein, partial [Frankia sp. CiP3]|uniref:hypothetical protein n=1 Tax=Frankia sp. CiP3 TaxID=2880971 RepID=UPI001EF5555D
MIMEDPPVDRRLSRRAPTGDVAKKENQDFSRLAGKIPACDWSSRWQPPSSAVRGRTTKIADVKVQVGELSTR